MEYFPSVDPIPLPAPVWLFKLLQLVTLALHFGAVYFLVGGLICATWWAWRGRRSQDPVLLNASGAMTHRLPVVMAYVVNLGIPPLLFTQVLYGRALYTSSVLMGVQWLMVIPLVIASYFMLYMMATRAESGRRYAWLGLLSIVIVLKVGYIYSSNMTLMLRPEVWTAMYREDALGIDLPTGDPTTFPRWIFMMVGGLGMGGIAMMLLGMQAPIDAAAAAFLRRRGSLLLAAGITAQILLGAWVVTAQPVPVRGELLTHPVYLAALGLWLVTAVGMVAVGGLAFRSAGARGWLLPGTAGGLGLVNILGWVVLRDGIRDTTLGLSGYDVWDRAVYANWITIIAFLVLFVVAGAFLAWMGSIVFGAKGGSEHYA
jgi:hypothetical protein